MTPAELPINPGRYTEGTYSEAPHVQSPAYFRQAGRGGRLPGLNSVEEIVADLKAGRMVLIMDDEDRENEGDLIMAAELATPEAVAFMIRYTSGIICVPMEEDRLTRLDLPQMVASNSESHRTAFTVSVDARAGTTTGVSSGDRAATIHALADSRSKPLDFARPGPHLPAALAPRAACWCGPATRRRPWISAAWPACSRWASSVR